MKRSKEWMVDEMGNLQNGRFNFAFTTLYLKKLWWRMESFGSAWGAIKWNVSVKTS